ncbi:hypothetical protein NLJ89_g5153 [Agrocybe chaxingu]|uniref:Uncharacterized protein n=1 Tax=Agrocybe chaxingu TaxID=84603 RepID=A0A9W8JZ32_9AGAR|nr:hypothetical protein NLJ89_g5153 [Agrocybe chaxingu]
MHVILFALCVRVLFRRKRKMQLAMLVAVVIMFVLATADVGVSWRIAVRHPEWMYVGDSRAFMKAILSQVFVAFGEWDRWRQSEERKGTDKQEDFLQMFYWKAILWVAGTVLLLGTAFGVVGEGTTSAALKKYIAVYIVSILVLNVALTLATAGRIFYIAREVKSIMGTELVSHYHFAVGILIESGLLYTAAAVLVFALSPTKFVLMAAAIAIRVVVRASFT